MLGVCYYPEHWPSSLWQQDAKEMAELGLKYVRIGEFAWSRFEPQFEQFDFTWFDNAIETLAAEGLNVILCPPTATPPKWLIDQHPEILPVDINTGTTRGFGSRRHYDFSSEIYRQHAMRITEILAKRYGEHPAVCGWQTDNEIACHDTTHSGSPAAKAAFQQWCKQEYGDIDTLNQRWGNVFWSMEYHDFSAIELPILAVTETNPAHQLAYRRFSSDQVIQFHNQMVAVIRQYAKNQFVTHNFIPMVDTQCDNFALAEPLDFASYDNYPLGRTDLFYQGADKAKFEATMRCGDPDFTSCSFDHIRGIGKGRFWIMEQQPGSVNWANYNPIPHPGMVRLWSWQAIAHGAECVSFFRWRQAPFAQEQMHAGIKRPDNSKADAWNEIKQLQQELTSNNFDITSKVSAKVAIIWHINGQWVDEIERQGADYHFQQVEFSYYQALRKLGLTVDFIAQDDDFSQYDLVVAPCLPMVDDDFIARCQASAAHFVFGPRAGSKTQNFWVPPNLAPGKLQALLPIKVTAVDTSRADCSRLFSYKDKSYQSKIWCEQLQVDEQVMVEAKLENGNAIVVRHQNVSYLGSLTCDNFLLDYFRNLATELELNTLELPDLVRLVERDNCLFVFNFSNEEQQVQLPHTGQYILGQPQIPPYDLAIYQLAKAQ